MSAGMKHNGTANQECTECGHFGNGQVPECECVGCDDTRKASKARQFCRTGIHSSVPAVTLTFDGGARKLHWCADHAADAESYR